GFESLEIAVRETDGCGHPDAQRIDLRALIMHLVMEVWTGRHAAHPDIADHLALTHPLAFMQAAGEGAQMAVGGGVLRAVLDFDVVAVARDPAGAGHDAIAGSVDRGSDRCAEIDAAMHAAVAEERVQPHAEARGDMGA